VSDFSLATLPRLAALRTASVLLTGISSWSLPPILDIIDRLDGDIVLFLRRTSAGVATATSPFDMMLSMLHRDDDRRLEQRDSVSAT
jgi:hypothetical protein